MQAAGQVVKIVKDNLIVYRHSDTLWVWKSILVHDDGPMMDSVQRLIKEEGWYLESEETKDEPEMHKDKAVCRIYRRFQEAA